MESKAIKEALELLFWEIDKHIDNLNQKGQGC